MSKEIHIRVPQQELKITFSSSYEYVPEGLLTDEEKKTLDELDIRKFLLPIATYEVIDNNV
jgi:hypothetical protein